ncbi:MAG: thioredoxin family protein [Calditrichaceae bacterium]|nr:thioredoxin family protein [Calditrichia bacterium]NUQ40886.1 thioredoxin family protein [Calditrichaceae bacterium]
MPILDEKVTKEVKKRLADLPHPVKIINFTQELECQFCKETRELLEDVAALSDKITLEKYDLVKDQEAAKKFNIDKIPAAIVMGEKDYGIRFFGIPSGYEFSTLLEAILMVSRRDSGLAEETRQKLAGLKQNLHLQVFITPTCPYCPGAVHLAHQFAMESDKVTADMVEAIEFPHLSQEFNVRGVPKTIANQRDAAEGALPEAQLLARVLAIAQ